MKIVTIIGARPQFVKAAIVSRAFNTTGIEEVIVHTGQHFDNNMSQVFFEEMNIAKPDYLLKISGGGHGAMTGKMMEKIEDVLLHEKPDGVMVYGDTNSTLAGALTAKKLHHKVIHVEAGLRSFNMQMPEEVNRILTDRVSDILFCPTKTAVKNLDNEGFGQFSCDVVRTGDVMQDAAIYYAGIALQNTQFMNSMRLKDSKYILCTLHRAENTDDQDRLSSIVTAINAVNKQITVLIPMHPRTKKVLKKYGISLDATVIEPVGYLEMITLLKNCEMVITDSGGLQKEAYFFDKYCVTVRDQTEWLELVDEGYNKVTGVKKENIINAVDEFIEKPFVKHGELYGGGTASKKIVDYLISHL